MRDLRAGEVTSSPSGDRRDLRNPQKLGEWLLTESPNRTCRKTYDAFRVKRDHIPNYPQDESMAQVTAREYLAELEAGAAAGDKYSQSALERIRNG